MLNVIYNNISSSDLGLVTTASPNIPTPVKIINEVQVPGRDGTLTTDTGAYNNVEITVSFAFLSDEKRIKSYEVKNWLLNAVDKRLKFDDDLEAYYKVKYVKIEDIIRNKSTGEFSVTFVCEPWTYIECREIEILNGESVNNYYDLSKPLITIYGEGVVNLNVNENILNANVGQNLIIDSEKMLAYRIDGTMNNTAISGDYPILVPGANVISWTGNVTKVLLNPNWRCI